MFRKIMSKKIPIIFSILILALLFSPIFSYAAPWEGLVKCGKNVAEGQTQVDCDFNALMDLINRLINFIIVYLAVPIAALSFAYAGFSMLALGGESAGGMEKAKNVFTNTVIGILLVAGAWLIIHTLLSILGYDGSWIGL